MNKTKLVISATIFSVLGAPCYAGNSNPASVDYVHKYVQSQIATIPITPTYIIGQHALGGIVFYVDITGMHGLVAANIGNFNSLTWDGGGTDFPVNATGNGIGAGTMNTSLIVSAQSALAAVNTETLSDMAAQVCVDYAVQADGQTLCAAPGTAGAPCYADWYLPSLYELNQMFLQNSFLNMWPNSGDCAFFWSSTEDGTSSGQNAWRINVSIPIPNAFSVSKSAENGAWCIRSF